MIGSKNLTPADLDSKEDAVLVEELKRAKEELFNLRFQSATGQLESHDIARIYTVLRERELGIRAVVAAAPVKAEKKATKAKSTESAKDTEEA
jgi:large subunit ribosomal protein L29